MLDEKYVEHQIKIDGRTIERQRYLVALRYVTSLEHDQLPNSIIHH